MVSASKPSSRPLRHFTAPQTIFEPASLRIKDSKPPGSTRPRVVTLGLIPCDNNQRRLGSGAPLTGPILSFAFQAPRVDVQNKL
jgi:hypothetical protein